MRKQTSSDSNILDIGPGQKFDADANANSDQKKEIVVLVSRACKEFGYCFVNGLMGQLPKKESLIGESSANGLHQNFRNMRTTLGEMSLKLIALTQAESAGMSSRQEAHQLLGMYNAPSLNTAGVYVFFLNPEDKPNSCSNVRSQIGDLENKRSQGIARLFIVVKKNEFAPTKKEEERIDPEFFALAQEYHGYIMNYYPDDPSVNYTNMPMILDEIVRMGAYRLEYKTAYFKLNCLYNELNTISENHKTNSVYLKISKNQDGNLRVKGADKGTQLESISQAGLQSWVVALRTLTWELSSGSGVTHNASSNWRASIKKLIPLEVSNKKKKQYDFRLISQSMTDQHLDVGKVYLSEKGTYIVCDSDGVWHKGSLVNLSDLKYPQDYSNYKEKFTKINVNVNDPDVQDIILKIATERGHVKIREEIPLSSRVSWSIMGFQFFKKEIPTLAYNVAIASALQEITKMVLAITPGKYNAVTDPENMKGVLFDLAKRGDNSLLTHFVPSVHNDTPNDTFDYRAVDSEGRTALHFAAAAGNERMVTVLMGSMGLNYQKDRQLPISTTGASPLSEGVAAAQYVGNIVDRHKFIQYIRIIECFIYFYGRREDLFEKEAEAISGFLKIYGIVWFASKEDTSEKIFKNFFNPVNNIVNLIAPNLANYLDTHIKHPTIQESQHQLFLLRGNVDVKVNNLYLEIQVGEYSIEYISYKTKTNGCEIEGEIEKEHLDEACFSRIKQAIKTQSQLTSFKPMEEEIEINVSEEDKNAIFKVTTKRNQTLPQSFLEKISVTLSASELEELKKTGSRVVEEQRKFELVRERARIELVEQQLSMWLYRFQDNLGRDANFFQNNNNNNNPIKLPNMGSHYQ